jgi:hypothetical protein
VGGGGGGGMISRSLRGKTKESREQDEEHSSLSVDGNYIIKKK